MLAKKTIKNQITLPKTVVSRFGNVEYFDVSTDGETIVLRPLRTSRIERNSRSGWLNSGSWKRTCPMLYLGRVKPLEAPRRV